MKGTPKSGYTKDIPTELADMTAKHPCYSFDAHHVFARMHLPVAPVCNISCNYCNRKYDCVNESRPGVTSEVLTPMESRDKFLRVKRELPNLSVVGIAGPGDALANWDAVKESIQLIQEQSPETIFCLSTNGLMLPQYADEIVDLGIKHVTVTANCLDAAIGAQIYHHVRYQEKYYFKEEGAAILIRNQMEGIRYLASKGILVKVNTVMIKDINAAHIPEVVKKVKSLGAFMTNIMPLIPAPGSAFANFPQTSMKEVNAMRDACQIDIRQMRHCQQCRADAIGLLTEDQCHNFRNTTAGTEKPPVIDSKKFKVAVASKHRMLVDLHYGHAEEFHIYEIDGVESRYIETRKTERYCRGPVDCNDTQEIKDSVIQTIADCDAVLSMRIGYDAQKRLAENGICSVESCTSVEEGLMDAFHQLNMKQAM